MVRYCAKEVNMSVKQYPIEEEGSGSLKASEPSVQEIIHKRRVSMSEVMNQSMTLEDSRKIMEERIYRFYHPEV